MIPPPFISEQEQKLIGMRAKTRATSAAVRARYGTASRFLGSLRIPSPAGTLSVHLFDLPGPKRVYAWLDPTTDEIVVVEHCADITSPHEAILAGRWRSTYRLKVERLASDPT